MFLLKEDDYRQRARLRGWRKLPLRFDMYVVYPLWLIAKTLWLPRGQTIIVTSNPFHAPLLISWIAKIKGHRVLTMLLDLYPDAITVAGYLKPKGAGVRLCAWWQRQTQKAVWRTIYLGEFLRSHTERMYGSAKRGGVIDIIADVRQFPDEFRPTPTVGAVRFRYSGQFGHLHDAESVAVALRLAWSQQRIAERANFSFFAGGPGMAALTEAFAGTRVQVAPIQTDGDWKQELLAYQIALVSLSPGGATVAMPSKTFAMMAGGLAILAICPLWSDLARVVQRHEAGWVVSNSPYPTEADLKADYEQRVRERRPVEEIAEDFVTTVEKILADRAEIDRRRRHAYEAMRGALSVEAVGARWRELLRESG